MSELMISVSGVRGIYGDGLDEALCGRFAYAFATLYGKAPIVVGRDSRISGQAISRAVIDGIRKTGTPVIDIGLASTPTTEMAVIFRNAAGAVMVTASHNPGEWNGLKFLGPDGVFLDAAQGAALLDVFNDTPDIAGYSTTGPLDTWPEAVSRHVDAVLDLPYINPGLIREQRFTVALDTVNGAGGPVSMELLERLGCRVHGVNLEPNGRFAHNPEPVPAHLGELCDTVNASNAAVGFAVDPDVDRLSLVDERGVAVGEEYTLAIAADYIMNRTSLPAACNLSTSRMIDDAAASYGLVVHRSPVGEINVVSCMRETGAGVGGEGNGGVILPELHYGRDAILGIALVLQILSDTNLPLSDAVQRFPAYVMVKEKCPVNTGTDWKSAVKKTFGDGVIDERDGVKVSFPDAWVHVRASNTEPILRIIAEGPDRKRVDSLIGSVRSLVEG